MKITPHNCFKLVLFLSFVSVSCSTSDKKLSADDLTVTWKMGENNYEGKSGFTSTFTIANRSKNEMTAGWNLYFNFPRSVKKETVTGNVEITHINGDFYELSPKPGFSLAAGDSVVITFVSSDWAMNQSDAPAGLYLVTNTEGKEDKPQVITNYTIKPFIEEKQTKRFPGDNIDVVTPTSLFQSHGSAALTASDLQPLVPAPASFKNGTGVFTLSQNVLIQATDDLTNEKKFLENSLAGLLQNALTTNNSKSINLSIGPVVYNGKQFSKGSEAYKLDITSNTINIVGSDAAGVFYGVQSLLGLLPVDSFKEKHALIEVPQISIVDYPRFEYRGIHLDVARNFQTKETVKKMLDLMAFYKLNKFHFHLSDDEGWRIEMESLPELTAIGGYRGHDKSGKGMVPSFGSGPFAAINESNGSGFYTQEDFIEILRYANDRHIEVIPKVDLPGHARAAIKAMDYRYEKLKSQENNLEATQYLLRDLQDSSQYKSVQGWNDNVVCVCQESTYNFISTVVNDFVKLYERANVPFTTFHIGADEVPHGVWEKSPVCKTFFNSQQIPLDGVMEYFFKRVSTILKEKNLNMGGWEEIALRKTKSGDGIQLQANPDFVNANFRPYVWNNVWGWEQEDVGYKLANAGYKTVFGNVTNLYFDLAYEKHPDEIGYYWGAFTDTRKVYEFNPFNIYLGASEDKFGNRLDQKKIASKVRITEAGKRNVLGIQGQLWAENLKGRQVLEYMAFPKLLALSERAWSKEPAWSSMTDDSKRAIEFDRQWAIFANTLGQRELPRLDYLFGGVNYRVSPPGAEIRNDTLYANVEFPGLMLRYTTDGTEPTPASKIYERPVVVQGVAVKMKAFTSSNRSSRTVTITGAQ